MLQNATQTGIKRPSIDLKLPANKKQRGTQSPALSAAGAPQQPQQPQQQQQQQQQQKASPQNQFQQGSPAVASTLSMGTPQQPIVDLTHPASTEMNHVSEPMMHNTPQVGMTFSQRQAQNQMVYQAAIASGLSPAIVSLLPPRALQCSWLLQQASQNRIQLTESQQQQIRAMLNERVEAVKQQLARQEQARRQSAPEETSQQASQMMQLLQQQQQLQSVSPQVQQQQPFVPLKQTPRALRAGMGPDDKVLNPMLYINDVLKDVATILASDEEHHEPEETYEVVREGRGALLFEPFMLKFSHEDEEELMEKERQMESMIKEEDVADKWYEIGMETGVSSMVEIMPGFHWNADEDQTMPTELMNINV
ncbi:MAG: hypothetical protein EXX96DRAFT_548372 [Benjaminiella poitrasii]|nr:MAG: hypothetical protein EXX96DRAFT_548372 [Benjaminiella poitrasii]